MKLFCIFAVLAVALADNESDKHLYEDLEAAETMELMKEGVDLKASASSYNYVPPSQRGSQWNQHTNYIPQQTWNQEKPINTYVPPPSPIIPPQNDVVPQKNEVPVQQDVYYPHWGTVTYPPTSTPSAVIKNEIYFGDNGSYKYEYQIADGTHVGEEGYFTDPKRTDESLVKKGWYSYVGADGKVYTVTYWADKTGYHAYGDHLPASPVQKPVYPTQAPTYHPTPAPTYYPTQPTTYYPPHGHYPHETNYPSYGKK